MEKQKWFHAIGACGKVTANVAKMFKKMGWFVTGTDVQFLPPASTILENADIPFELGYHYTHMTKEFWEEKLNKTLNISDVPDLSLVVDTATSHNKEYLFAKKEGIDVRPFSQILGEYLIKPNSIVVIGTAGKTTTTALATTILKNLGLNPSYMIGADVIDFEESIENTDSEWSVIEGDEYFGKEVSRGAKFLEFKPKYLIITNIGWEHQDVYPTQELYLEAFRRCAELVPDDGLIVARAGDQNIDEALRNVKAKVIRYGVSESKEQNSTFNYSIRPLSDNSSQYAQEFEIYDEKNDRIMSGGTNLIGEYNLENIVAVTALIKNIPELAEKLGENLFVDILENSIKEFRGPKKRLEILYKSDNLIIVDDFGVAPNRARNSLKTLKEAFPEYSITAVFEPNSGSRIKDSEQFNTLYKTTFINAEKVYVPELSNFSEGLISSEEIVARLKNLNVNAFSISSENIITTLLSNAKENYKTLIVFFSSYRLDNIEKELVQKIR